MNKGRLEAFSDGVIAVIITIMVLELHAPHGVDLDAVRELAPNFCAYVLSFAFIGIYWNNHHHMLHMASRVNGRILWSNLHLLFWLSLVPIATAWMGENHLEPLPTAIYGVVLLCSGVAYLFLQWAIIAEQGENSKLREAIGDDRKGRLSALMYSTAIGVAWVSTWAAQAIFLGVALVWVIPDRRIEARLRGE